MIKIELGNEVFDFPGSWSETTLEQFQKLTELKHDVDNLSTSAEMISALSGIPVEKLDSLQFTEFCKLAEICKFTYDEHKEPPKFELNIDGVSYKMIREISKMSTGEFVDLDTLLKDKQNAIGNLHIIMAILYRPFVDEKIEKYNSETLHARAELFKKKMTCDYVLSAMVFSLAIGKELFHLIPDYSQGI